MEEFTAFRDVLHAELKELDEADELGREGRKVVELDQQSVGRLSRMDALQNQAMAQAQAGRRAARRTAIATALGRIDDGTFGLCADCDELIEPKRLSFDATTRLCLDCQRG
ncbi:MAG: TraR/DksA C4-type zinc finger protein [Pseudomonadota bacterium]